MIRTQVYIPDDLHREALLVAKIRNVNFSTLVREGLAKAVKIKKVRRSKNWGEGFFGAGGKIGPKDLSSKIDYYLYGKGSKWGKK